MSRISANEHMRLDPIRADVRRQVEALRDELPRISVTEIGRRTEALRQLGRRHGLFPFWQIAACLGDAVARDGRGAIITAYLQTMIDAIYCDSRDRAAGELFLAAVNVRLAS